MTDGATKRIMTSAIPGMSVAQVRKALGIVRKRATTELMYITDLLTDKLTIEQFCLEFVTGHHQKRHAKGKKTDEISDSETEMEENDTS